MNESNAEAKTVLVTGGSGYIGGMVCRLLVAAGHNVINVDRVKKEIPGVTQYPFDLNNHQMKGVINLTKPDSIMHFAADHEVGRSVTDPGVFYGNNVANTINLINNAVDAGVKKFIFSSSSSVYGDIQNFPTTEDTATNPISAYGLTKKMVEDMLPDYDRAYGMKFVNLRYFNAAGASPDNTHGYTQNPASHLVPIIAKAIIKGEPVQVFGNDYDTDDGTCERDYTHVFDIATAHLAALNYLDDKGTSNTFNLGQSSPNSVMQVIEAFERVTFEKVNYEVVDRRAGDPPKTYADITKARDELGWAPIYGLDEIVAHSFEWEKNQK
jgi:UDP-glucose 4-epimerase